MLYFPDVQAKAQAEIDRVVGTERLPSFDDRAELPYIQAIVLEVLRWRLITPLALPHVPVADEVFNGYWIPSGTIVMANAWYASWHISPGSGSCSMSRNRAMLHDPEVYSDPDEFKPERFLKTNADGAYELDPTVLDPRTIAFGFGRRCLSFHLT
jgi:cytochrome P450